MSDNYTNGGSGSYAVEQARHDFEQNKESSISKLANFSTVQEENGKHYWMGMEVAPDVAPLLVHATSGLPALVNDALNGGVYKYANKLHETLGKQLGGKVDSLASHNFGLKAAAGAMALLIGAQPIMEVSQSVKNRTSARKEIRKNLGIIIETNDHYSDNEVIQTAMERTQKVMMAGLRNAAAQLPTVLANGYFAFGNHKLFAKEKTDAFAIKSESANIAANPKSAMEEFVRQSASDHKEIKELAAKHGIPEGSREYDKLVDGWERKVGGLEEHAANHDDVGFKADSTTQQLVVGGALVGNILAKRQVSKHNDEDLAKPTAYRLILDLRDQINNGDISKGADITSQIVEIFQQNEIDRKRPPIGEALMERFNPLAERIAEVVSNRELDVLSLVNLVGEGKIVNKRRFINTDQVEELIDSQRKVFGSHEKTPVDEFLADFQNPKMIMQAIKENLKNLDGNEKAVFASMFSDDVLLSAGVKKKDILPLRTRGHDFMCDFVKSSAAELAKKKPEELKAGGLSEKQIEAIGSFNELMASGDDKAVKSAICSPDNNVVRAVRNAKLEEQIAGGAGRKSWTQMIKPKPNVASEKPIEVSRVESVKAGRENGSPLVGV